eukprot:1156970-Pelagomonas_calceolata.AAC.2
MAVIGLFSNKILQTNDAVRFVHIVPLKSAAADKGYKGYKGDKGGDIVITHSCAHLMSVTYQKSQGAENNVLLPHLTSSLKTLCSQAINPDAYSLYSLCPQCTPYLRTSNSQHLDTNRLLLHTRRGVQTRSNSQQSRTNASSKKTHSTCCGYMPLLRALQSSAGTGEMNV